VNAALVGSVLVASLAGSLHCAGMCGGFVAFYSGAGRATGGRRFATHVAYNGGRLTTYLVLGALAGSLGAAVDLAGRMAGATRMAALVAGLLMVGWGVYALLQSLGVRLPRLPLPSWIGRMTSRTYAKLRDRPPLFRALLLGLTSTLLPCGWLYAYALLAAGTASPWLGMLVMAAFWAGTVPVMLGLGLSVQAFAAPLRRRLPAVTAAMLILVGLLWLAGRVTMTPHSTHGRDVQPQQHQH